MKRANVTVIRLLRLLGISYDEWLRKAREILLCPDSPLSLKNGIWKVVNRTELLHLLGSRILDHESRHLQVVSYIHIK